MLLLPSYSLDGEQEKSLQEFLLEEEYKCVYITSYVFKNSNFIGTTGNNQLWVVLDESDKTTGVVYINPSGAIFPYFSKKYKHDKEIGERLQQIIKLVSPYMILGEKKSCKIVNDVLKKKINMQKNHFLMLKDKDTENKKNKNKDNIIIRLATPSDMEELYKLQENYEKEEVLPDVSLFSPASCIHKINTHIKTKSIMVAEYNGKIVAKAEISAKGVLIYQIGGVYTLPEYRNRGIATELVRNLIKLIEGSSKKVCLFVRKDNKPAYKVYKKLGFSTVSDFSIVYLKKGL
ncbi:GNAT family N-acetyltransferase [Spirochaetia bacterium 38H-sp]|uniref:GNAT family N-acetyltransferase n=1 Tax=Rarispira pelagica TaxID=3141764 RepID=A0ABU9UEI6_9SPIR